MTETVSDNPLSLRSVRSNLDRIADSLQNRPGLLIGLMSIFYVFLVLSDIGKMFSFDELFTFYIAKQASVRQLLNANLHADLNPPLLYLIVRFSQWIFGENEFATRLPSAAGFLIGSIAFYRVLGKRTGYLVSGCAIALFWAGFFLLYAVEARPYGLLVCFFGLALYLWDIYPVSQHPIAAAFGLLVCITGMMLSHVLAPFSIMPLLAGELARSIRQRRVGILWIPLLAPMSIEFAYLFWMRRFGTYVFPDIFQASLPRMIRFYGRLAHDIWIPLAAATASAFIASRWDAKARRSYRFPIPDLAIGAGRFLIPYAIIAALARTHGAFHFRYAIVGSLVLWTMYALVLNYLTRNQSGPALVFILVLLSTSLGLHFVSYVNYHKVYPGLASVAPNLPLVAGSGLTFLQINHYEPPGVTSRLIYLTDPQYAVQYAHDTLFEGYRGLKTYFPIKGRVESYRAFVAENSHFLVFGDINYLEDWLLRRLADEPKFSMKIVGRVRCCYKDNDIYEVNLRADQLHAVASEAK